jgi:hypothetical protein
MTARCYYCVNAIDPHHPTTYRRVMGWERKALGASRKSGSDIVLREPREEFACRTCIDRLKRGVSVDQGSLLG